MLHFLSTLCECRFFPFIARILSSVASAQWAVVWTSYPQRVPSCVISHIPIQCPHAYPMPTSPAADHIPIQCPHAYLMPTTPAAYHMPIQCPHAYPILAISPYTPFTVANYSPTAYMDRGTPTIVRFPLSTFLFLQSSSSWQTFQATFLLGSNGKVSLRNHFLFVSLLPRVFASTSQRLCLSCYVSLSVCLTRHTEKTLFDHFWRYPLNSFKRRVFEPV